MFLEAMLFFLSYKCALLLLNSAAFYMHTSSRMNLIPYLNSLLSVFPLFLCVCVFESGCSQCHRHGTRPQQVSVHGCAASPDQMCSTVCGDRAVFLAHRLPAAHSLPPVQRLLPHQGSEGRHRGVSAGCLWVRLEANRHT